MTQKPQTYTLPTAHDGICELILEVSGNVTATLSNAEGERCVISYNEADHTVSFDRLRATAASISSPSTPCSLPTENNPNIV